MTMRRYVRGADHPTCGVSSRTVSGGSSTTMTASRRASSSRCEDGDRQGDRDNGPGRRAPRDGPPNRLPFDTAGHPQGTRVRDRGVAVRNATHFGIAGYYPLWRPRRASAWPSPMRAPRCRPRSGQCRCWERTLSPSRPLRTWRSRSVLTARRLHSAARSESRRAENPFPPAG